MQNRFSVKTFGVLVVLVYTFGISFINYTFALICYECEDETCDVGPVYIRTCEEETSVCVLFKDATGRALNKEADHVYRRSCGSATYPNNRSDWNCTQYTQNFDKCLCREDLCNGDESLMALITTTKLYPPETTEINSNEDAERDRSFLKNMMSRKFFGRDSGDDAPAEKNNGKTQTENNHGKTQTVRKKCNKKSQIGRSQGGIPQGGISQSGRSQGGYQNGRYQSGRSQGSRSRNNKAMIKQNRYDDYSGSDYDYQNNRNNDYRSNDY